uniref:GIY-YIG endonuclease n=1 Tax=Bacillus phage KoopaTroopa TaxID=3234046 RepID=A0AB39C7C5_9CAUD
MQSKFYVYRFLDKDDKTIYIGRTNNLKRRIENEHFSKYGHLPKECYDKCKTIEFMDFDSESEMKIWELYLINRYSPQYNIMENRNDDFTFNLEEHWTEYKNNDIMSKKEYKVYSFIVMHSDAGQWCIRIDIDTLADGIKIKNRETLMRILESLNRKSYIQLRQYGKSLTICHSLRDIKFPKE